MGLYDLRQVFDREIQILSGDGSGFYYAIDRKSEKGNSCDLCHYDLVSGRQHLLVSLDGVRVNESFDSFPLQADAFFAVSVGDDYKVSLTVIDKKSWQVKDRLSLSPRGEILNIFPIDGSHMLLVDEVPVTKAVLQEAGDLSYRGRYLRMTDLLDVRTGEKVNLTKLFGGRAVTDLRLMGDLLIFTLADQEESSAGLYQMPVGSLNEYLTGESLASCQLAEGSRISLYGDAGRTVSALVYDREMMPDRLLTCQAGEMTEKDLRQLPDMKKLSDVIWSPFSDRLWALLASDQGMRVSCLNDQAQDWFYDPEEGEFLGAAGGGMYALTLYEPEMIGQEPVFREKVLISGAEAGPAVPLKGTAFSVGEHIILLNSYLFL